MVPPCIPVAPTPTLNFTKRFVALYSAWSSPAASVFTPAFGPLTTVNEPGTYWVRISSVSVIKQLTASSEPIFLPETVYSKISPGTTAPPLRSLT